MENSREDLKTLLVQRQTFDEEDSVKKQYLNQVLSIQKEAQRHFQARNLDKTVERLEKLEEMSMHAYDVEVLKEVSFSLGLVHTFFGNHQNALRCLRQARNLADEVGAVDDKKYAYRLMAKSYQRLKQYGNAVKCYKKLMESAWDTGDYGAEMKAYQGLAVQYFYLGDIRSAKYYCDRLMSGRFETEESWIRQIYMNQVKYKREEAGKKMAELVNFDDLEENPTNKLE